MPTTIPRPAHTPGPRTQQPELLVELRQFVADARIAIACLEHCYQYGPAHLLGAHVMQAERAIAKAEGK